MRKKRKGIIRIVAGTVLIAFVGLLGYAIYLQLITKQVTPPEGFRKLEKGFYSQGIDVSHYQNEIDWNAVMESSGEYISFVFCKATEGVSLVDAQWKTNNKALRKRKVPIGAYHYFKPELSAKLQAEHFLRHYKVKKDDLPPVLDVEEEGTDDEKLRYSITEWLNIVEEATGKRPIIYTNYYLFNLKFRLFFPEHFFWIANYSNKPERMEDNRILFWQYSDQGRVHGIEGPVDLNMSKVKF